VWYNTEKGIPYFNTILGQPVNWAYIRSKLSAEALKAVGATSSKVFFKSIDGRKMTGQIQVTTTSGTTVSAGF